MIQLCHTPKFKPWCDVSASIPQPILSFISFPNSMQHDLPFGIIRGSLCLGSTPFRHDSIDFDTLCHGALYSTKHTGNHCADHIQGWVIILRSNIFRDFGPHPDDFIRPYRRSEYRRTARSSAYGHDDVTHHAPPQEAILCSKPYHGLLRGSTPALFLPRSNLHRSCRTCQASLGFITTWSCKPR